jgi:type IX secretion system substrate protein
MKKIYALILFCSVSAASIAQTICNPSGNLIIFSNYDGGILNIDVDANIPNLKIGVVSYEGTKVNIIGAFAANVTAVAYAGYNGSNVHCGSSINTTITGAPGGATTNISIYPPTSLSNPNGSAHMVCAYSCSTTTNQGGCNTVDQVEDYFLDYFPGSVLYAHKVQYGCWSGNQLVSAGGTCCALTTGIDSKELTGFSLFPNPATNELNISFEGSMNNGSVKIMNPAGQLVKEDNNVSGSTAKINVSDISAGIYFVEINNSGTIFRTRFVKN